MEHPHKVHADDDGDDYIFLTLFSKIEEENIMRTVLDGSNVYGRKESMGKKDMFKNSTNKSKLLSDLHASTLMRGWNSNSLTTGRWSLQRKHTSNEEEDEIYL